MKISSSILTHILTNYSQPVLFAKYFRLPLSSIEYCLEDKNNKVNNPLREDYTPSLGFMYKTDGKLICKDWGDDIYSGDIFEIVGVLTSLNCNNSKDFITICRYIIDDNTISSELCLQTS